MQRLLFTVRRTLRLAGLIALGASLGAGAWIAPVAASPNSQDSNPATLRVATPAITNLDPVQVSRFDPYTRDLVEDLFVGLTRYDPNTQQIEPMLAKNWSMSDDRLTWTFTLRDDIQWVRFDEKTQEITAVRPVVAGDFAYAIQRACDPLRPSPVTANLMVIRGCQTIANAFPEVVNDVFIAREIGVRATGPTTLEIDLLFPSAYFPTLTSTPEFRPLAREEFSTETAASGKNLFTNGPYALTKWTSTGMTLDRNPYWPDSINGNIDQVAVSFTGDTITAPMLFAGSRVDFARLDSTEVEAVRAAQPDALHVAPGNTITMLGFSYDRALVEQPEVRRALAFSIDRAALVEQLLPDQALPITQFTPPGMVAEPDYNGLQLNIVQAQADYAAAGYPDCTAVPEKLIVLVPEDDPQAEALGQFVTQQWADNLGCNPALFEVKTLPHTIMIELSHATYDPEAVTRSHIWLATWIADYPDASAWIADALHCRYGYIRTGRECDQADTLLDQAAAEMDPAKRAELYTQAEAMFFGPQGSFPVIPLFVSTSTWLQQPRLTGVNQFGPARFDLWTLDTDAQPPA